MIRAALIAALCVMPMIASAAEPPAPADAGGEMPALPYPDRITALVRPINAAVAIAPGPARAFQTEIIWGPDKAPGFYALRASGEIAIETEGERMIAVLERSATEAQFGPKQRTRGDAGKIRATIMPDGAYRLFELHLPGLDDAAHRAQFADLGSGLIDTGRLPPFRRQILRAGPGDTAGASDIGREREARSNLLEAIQPLLGLVIPLPASGVSTGDRLTVLRRDLGDLFRGAAPIPFTVEGEVKGLAEIDGRRFIALRLERADLAPPMRANVDGYALIDVASGLVETLVAKIELVILHGTEASVFHFVDRRVLAPPPDAGR